MKHLSVTSRIPPAAPLALAALALLGSAETRAGSRLTLSEFLGQVEAGNPALRAAIEGARAAEEKKQEADLVTMPQFFADTQWGKDARRGLFFAYDWLTNSNYSLGVQQQTSFGLSAKVSYTLSQFEYSGLPPQFLLGNPTLAAPFAESTPRIELSQSLWKNAFGSETRAREKQIEAAAEAQRQGELLKGKFSKVEAEIAYWRLSLARAARDIASETLERARKLASWSDRRASQGLADRSDALQGSSAVRLRELQYQTALDEERAARLAFNSSRGVRGDAVAESLDLISDETIQAIARGANERRSPTAPAREDLAAAEQQLRLAEASADLGRARNTPTFDVFGQAALFSRNADTGDAVSESFGTEQYAYGGGVRFVLPLDFGSWTSARAGYERERQSAELNFERKRLENDQEWSDLNLKLAESLQRLEITRRLEDNQKEKSDYERDRYNRGRSTTYQVLNFEEDYAQARLNRLRNLFEALTLGARLKTFETSAAARPEGDLQ